MKDVPENKNVTAASHPDQTGSSGEMGKLPGTAIRINREFDAHACRYGSLWAARGDRIFFSKDGGNSFSRYLTVPAGWLKARSKLLNRLLRQGIHHLLPISAEEILVVVKRKFWIVRQGALHRGHRLQYGSRPLRSGICITPERSIIYGDYWSNPRRLPVRLHISRDGGSTWDILWQSQPGAARHIHLVCPVDDAADEIYFSTGDYGPEPALYRLNIRNGKVLRIGGGSQSWRMLGLLQKGHRLIWGSDCEYEQNYVYQYDLHKSKLTRLQDLPGPAYYVAEDKNGFYYLATTVEHRRRHRACILGSRDSTRWHILACYKKDKWPPRYFGYGIIEFIEGQEYLEDLWVNLRGLKCLKKRDCTGER